MRHQCRPVQEGATPTTDNNRQDARCPDCHELNGMDRQDRPARCRHRRSRGKIFVTSKRARSLWIIPSSFRSMNGRGWGVSTFPVYWSKDLRWLRPSFAGGAQYPEGQWFPPARSLTASQPTNGFSLLRNRGVRMIGDSVRVVRISVPECLVEKSLTCCLVLELIIEIDVVDLQLACEVPELAG